MLSLLFTIVSYFLFAFQAATFGKSFLTDTSPQAFVTMCRTLRVLNAVRDYMVGVPLTYGQYPFKDFEVINSQLLAAVLLRYLAKKG